METRNILIVDDAAADRESVAIALRRDTKVRYKIFEASTGQAGLDQIAELEDAVDLVFLDFGLPDMDANDFIEHMGPGHGVPLIPIVVLTGSMSPDTAGMAALQHGVQDFFTKDEVTSSVVSRIAHNAIERHRLLQRLIESEQQASKAVEKAVRADRAKSQFLALISHELRTPLTAILGFCRLLEQDPDNGDRTKMLRMVIDSGEHLEELLNDLIDIAKIEAGTLELDPVEFDPRELIRSTVALFEGRASDKGLELILDIDVSTPPAIRTDRVRLRQILVNLIGNAIKFTETGAVECHVQWNSEQASLEITVSDTGSGIPEPLVPNLFSPFNQGEISSEQKREGVGLGLAISKQLAEMMGGDLCVAHTDSTGTEFVATVAATSVASPIDSTGGTSRGTYETDLSGIRIVVADDTPANQFLLERLLTRQGARVTIVANGSELLDFIDNSDPPEVDVILMDMLMPVMNGFDATRELRQRGHQIPVIAVTAAASRDNQSVCIDAGCDIVVTKPIDLVELYFAIDKVT
ncbi:MAG: response regulator [Planctomycetaceae bacterium]|nr:response regulator [Planctomycetaceae bacterium]